MYDKDSNDVQSMGGLLQVPELKCLLSSVHQKQSNMQPSLFTELRLTATVLSRSSCVIHHLSFRLLPSLIIANL